ncbi:hypothetical protein [Pedobacter aquatilis]|uniref:hypothetical protein n=1 Tax=Pedobacter aquatilis TaxID=351343 RepID=UPI0029314E69|nr:hypothetical protein [Pedobacter aquatilis]
MNIAKKIVPFVLILICFSFQLSAQEAPGKLNKTGFYLGIYTGTWFGTGQNSILSNPIMGGLLLELKSGKGALAVNFDFFGNPVKTKPIYLKTNDKIIEKTNYLGVQISLQYSHELYQRNKFALEAVGGFGYGDIGFKVPETEDYVSKSSLFVDPGIGARYFIGQNTYLQFKLQYNLANYKFKDNETTNIGGNFVTTKLIFGWR